MKTSQVGIDLIKKFEGVRLKAYKAHVSEEFMTIGYGHYSSSVRVGQTITQEQAEELLKKDLKRFEDNVNECVKVPLNQNQFDALIAFSFNTGEHALKTSTLLKKLNAKDYVGASKEFLKWVKAGNEVLNGLIRRRKAEMDLFLKAAPVKKPTVKPKPKPKTGDVVPFPGKVLKRGSKGKDVDRIRQALKLKKTGVFDAELQKAVKEYQERKNLVVDGTVGKNTWSMLF